MPEDKMPKDEAGNPLWTKRKEVLVPEDQEHTKLETYDCKNLDTKTGECRDYENRPEICKNSGCVNPELQESLEEQHKKMKEKKFIKIR
jgi:Fe-S-cluster containining protein